MEKITRRLFIRKSALSGLAAASVAAPIISEAATRDATAQEHWDAFIATLGDRVPEGARLRVFGSVTGAKVEILVTRDERIHPKVVGYMSVERCAAEYRLTPDGWEGGAW